MRPVARSISARPHVSRVSRQYGVATMLLIGVAACAGDAGSVLAPSDGSDAARKRGSDSTVNAPVTPVPTTPSANPLLGSSFWSDPLSNARKTADAWRISRPADAAQMDKIAAEGVVRWIGNWNADVQGDVSAATTTMSAGGALPVFVAYNIPQRDCGGLSGGNSTTADAYRSWIASFANGIGNRRAAVILEPDALAAMDCLSASDQQLRLSLLNFAVQTLHAKGSIAVYLDAGHPGWQSVTTMATRLTNAGVSLAQGFSLNVSNFIGTSENVSYGTALSAQVGGKHFVIDTGRNGLGPTADNQWCNPAGRALGARPTTQTGNLLVDAFLWIKTPGESDGACAGAPSSGVFMPEYALGLAQRAAY